MEKMLIKPCPICKGDGELKFENLDPKGDDFDSIRTSVRCKTCGMSTGLYLKNSKAVEVWNNLHDKVNAVDDKYEDRLFESAIRIVTANKSLNNKEVMAIAKDLMAEFEKVKQL